MSNDDPQTLKDVAQAALDNNRGMSGRSLDVEAKRRGLSIVYTTINHMVAGTYKSTPGRKTLEALAELSGYSVEQVYRAAKVPMPMRPLAEDLPPDSDLLTGPQRRVVIDTVRLFAQQNRALHESEARAKGGQADGNTSAKKSATGAREPVGTEGGLPVYEAESHPTGDVSGEVMPPRAEEDAQES
jgi:hypothetical protein